jgi:TPR repeat protein
MRGEGAPKDPCAAEGLLLDAAERGETTACAALAELYALWTEPADPERARGWLARAAAAGDPQAAALAHRLGRASLPFPLPGSGPSPEP